MKGDFKAEQEETCGYKAQVQDGKRALSDGPVLTVVAAWVPSCNAKSEHRERVIELIIGGCHRQEVG